MFKLLTDGQRYLFIDASAHTPTQPNKSVINEISASDVADATDKLALLLNRLEFGIGLARLAGIGDVHSGVRFAGVGAPQ